MPDFFDSIRDLFRRPADPKQANEAFVKEALTREASAERAYETWLNEGMTESLARLRSYWLTGDDAHAREAGFVHHDGATTRGLVIPEPERHFGPGAGAFLQDWMADRIAAIGYYRQHSEARSWLRPKGVERLERIHLKPRFAYDEQARKSNQQFGNITLEHRLWDGQSTDLKLINNIYHDRAWFPAQAFQDLLEQLLDPDMP